MALFADTCTPGVPIFTKKTAKICFEIKDMVGNLADFC